MSDNVYLVKAIYSTVNLVVDSIKTAYRTTLYVVVNKPHLDNLYHVNKPHLDNLYNDSGTPILFFKTWFSDPISNQKQDKSPTVTIRPWLMHRWVFARILEPIPMKYNGNTLHHMGNEWSESSTCTVVLVVYIVEICYHQEALKIAQSTHTSCFPFKTLFRLFYYQLDKNVTS